MFSVKTFLAVSLMAIGSRAAIAEIRQVASGTDLYNCHDNCGKSSDRYRDHFPAEVNQ